MTTNAFKMSAEERFNRGNELIAKSKSEKLTLKESIELSWILAVQDVNNEKIIEGKVI